MRSSLLLIGDFQNITIGAVLIQKLAGSTVLQLRWKHSGTEQPMMLNILSVAHRRERAIGMPDDAISVERPRFTPKVRNAAP